ncbi:MAG: PAS domain-containing protein [Rhodocyclaceae bacterium]|nr:PAS domain-containing protein [Rhodocyclaceae bacterium]MBX3670070.1 PAS domain-containing protein [Rhodocyclaceae bacterium]
MQTSPIEHLQQRRHRSASALVLLAGLVLPALAAWYAGWLFGADRWVHEPLHAVVESLGGMIAYVAAAILLYWVADDEYGQRLPTALGLMAMGTLDIVHAAQSPGNLFVWLHSWAVFLGGLGFACVWSPAGWYAGRTDRLVPVAVAGFWMFALGSVAASDLLPAMLAGDGAFRGMARALNIGGGLLFYCASFFFARGFARTGGRHDLMLAGFSAVAGAAGLLFELSRLWDASWWLWHALRLVAYVVLVEFVYFFGRYTTRASLEADINVFDAVPAGILAVDGRGRIRYANKAAAKIFKLELEDLRTRSVEDFLPAELRTGHVGLRKHYMQDPVDTKMGQSRNLFAIDALGGKVPLDVFLSPIHRKQGSLIVVTLIDVTERARHETERAQRARELERSNRELERSNRELDKFAYVASHDLRSPLQNIRLLASWIEEDLDDREEVNSHLDLLKLRVQRMERLLEDLLQYARIGRKKEQIEEVDISQMVSEIFDLLNAQRKFELVLAGDLPKFETWRVPLHLVFRNLLANAIKHHDRGSGRVSVSCVDAGAEFVFRVEDDGPGIPEAYREKVFEMFTTLKSKDEVEGSGMGLAIIRKTTEEFGGNILAEPRSERGTCFRFTWPKALSST